VAAIRADKEQWVEFMMRFELGLEPPEPARARQSALTIALSYIAGGLVPLSPYILLNDLQSALLVSVGLTLVALFLFGYFKGR
ncbi:MAG: VIT1/CCC1 transporter family protein, partial [Anaerolineales bacterium]|nr:VIT1/CCC1 transporter family protein [Anaerolineales bacterium]